MKTFYFISVFFTVLIAGAIMGTMMPVKPQPRVDLPEEYKLITLKDTLRGNYKNGILYIEFNNKRNK